MFNDSEFKNKNVQDRILEMVVEIRVNVQAEIYFEYKTKWGPLFNLAPLHLRLTP